MTHLRSKMLILVIDDDHLMLEYLKNVLEDLADVVVADGGADGLSMAKRCAPNLIISDLVMPNIDGIAVCEQVRMEAETRFIPVLCISACGDAEDEISALSAGASDFVRKPIVPSLLRARVKYLLRWHKESSSLREMAARDDMTGLLNRRRFDELFAEEWTRQKRAGGFLTLAMVDIDKFKDFNDFFGHACGDDCLAAVASSLGEVTCRPGDVVARYGGEEFVFLMPNRAPEQVRELGRDICEAIRAMRLPHAPCLDRNVSVSVGLASAVPAEGGSPQELLMRADNALYEAKAAGRDRYVVNIDVGSAIGVRLLAGLPRSD